MRRRPSGAIVEAFQQRPAEPLHDAALDLALDRRRIERQADVLKGGIAQDGDQPAIGVDLHIAHVRTDLDAERQFARNTAPDDGAIGQRRLHQLR